MILLAINSLLHICIGGETQDATFDHFGNFQMTLMRKSFCRRKFE
jgi:hypothetical protein